VRQTHLHIALGILLWIVFGYYWTIVVQQPLTPHTRVALAAVGSIVGGIVVFLYLWVLHNMHIARRKRRKSRPDAVLPPLADFLGRTFIATSDEELRRASYIEVHVVETEDDTGLTAEHKIFRVADQQMG
jgi:hypothetical protein